MEECEMLTAGKTNFQRYQNHEKMFCEIENCPYGNGLRLSLNEDYITICQTQGLVKKKGLIKMSSNEAISI